MLFELPKGCLELGMSRHGTIWIEEAPQLQDPEEERDLIVISLD